jgi:hypothetical protein
MNFFLPSALTCLLCFPVVLQAQDVAAAGGDPVIQELPITAQIDASVVREQVDADGFPVLDADGNAVIVYEPVTDTPVIPGDQVRYMVTMENLGPDVTNFSVAFDIPAQGLLIPETIASDWDATFYVGTTDLPEVRTEIFEQGQDLSAGYLEIPDGEIAKIHASIPTLAAGEAGVISYNMMIR